MSTAEISERVVTAGEHFPMIKWVTVADLLEARELIAEYAVECSIPAIGEINPQAGSYRALESSGWLRSFAVFDDGRMVGFANVLTGEFPHYGVMVATVESLFVAKESRRSAAGPQLMAAIEEYAKNAGCVGILYSSPVGGQLERLLEVSKEYQRTNAVFFRRFA